MQKLTPNGLTQLIREEIDTQIRIKNNITEEDRVLTSIILESETLEEIEYKLYGLNEEIGASVLGMLGIYKGGSRNVIEGLQRWFFNKLIGMLGLKDKTTKAALSAFLADLDLSDLLKIWSGELSACKKLSDSLAKAAVYMAARALPSQMQADPSTPWGKIVTDQFAGAIESAEVIEALSGQIADSVCTVVAEIFPEGSRLRSFFDTAPTTDVAAEEPGLEDEEEPGLEDEEEPGSEDAEEQKKKSEKVDKTESSALEGKSKEYLYKLVKKKADAPERMYALGHPKMSKANLIKMIQGKMDIPLKKSKAETPKSKKKGKKAPKIETPASDEEKIGDIQQTIKDLEAGVSDDSQSEAPLEVKQEPQAVKRFKNKFLKSGEKLVGQKTDTPLAGSLNVSLLDRSYPSSPAAAAKRSVRKMIKLAKELDINLTGINLKPDFDDEYDTHDTIEAIASKIINWGKENEA